jgi:hypothetical protein
LVTFWPVVGTGAAAALGADSGACVKFLHCQLCRDHSRSQSRRNLQPASAHTTDTKTMVQNQAASSSSVDRVGHIHRRVRNTTAPPSTIPKGSKNAPLIFEPLTCPLAPTCQVWHSHSSNSNVCCHAATCLSLPVCSPRPSQTWGENKPGSLQSPSPRLRRSTCGGTGLAIPPHLRRSHAYQEGVSSVPAHWRSGLMALSVMAGSCLRCDREAIQSRDSTRHSAIEPLHVAARAYRRQRFSPAIHLGR